MTTHQPRPTLEEQLNGARQTGDAAQEARILVALAQNAHDDEADELAQAFYGQAWAAYQRAGDLRGQARVLIALRDLATPSTEELPDREAIFIPERFETLALALYEEAGDLREQATIWFKRGRDMIYRAVPRENVVMITALEKAMKLYLKLGDQQGQASVFAEFGILEMMSNAPDRAKPALEKAISLFGEESISRTKALALYHLGKIAAANKQPLEALNYLKDAQATYEKNPMHGDEAIAASRYEEIGTFAIQAGEYVQARLYLEDAWRDCEEKARTADSIHRAWRQRSVAQVLQKLGPVASALGDYATADEHFQRAHRLFADNKNTSHQIAVLREWARSRALAGDLAASRQHYGEALSLNTTLDLTRSPAILWDWGQSEYQAGEHQRGYDYCRRALQDLTAYRREEDKSTLHQWVQTLARMKPS